jgi:hypothetical protein
MADMPILLSTFQADAIPYSIVDISNDLLSEQTKPIQLNNFGGDI